MFPWTSKGMEVGLTFQVAIDTADLVDAEFINRKETKIINK